MQLSEWQNLLEVNFETLGNDRHRIDSDQPLFGLEHNLSKDQREDLCQAIRDHIKNNPPLKEHWLVWVVYASEMGYRYDGHEYWQTFEKKTVGWKKSYGKFLQTYFKTFHKKFKGIKPVGSWAEYYKYICWPIRNAILPDDLQAQLVKAIHSSASSLRQDFLENPILYGELIEKHSQYSTSRFRQLIQEKKLVGEIATALFLKGTEGSSFSELFISQPALNRIVQDLETKQENRGLLQDARKKARGRLKLGSLRRRLRPVNIDYDERVRNEQEKDYLVPKLYLRPNLPLEENQWELRLKLPNLSQLAVNFPDLKDTLNNSRSHVEVEGCKTRIARGRLLHPKQAIKLERWPLPSGDTEFLSFENSPDILKRILKNCSPDLTRLFKVSEDGNAYEIKSSIVHAKKKYIFLYDEEYSCTHQFILPLKLECEGIKALLIELPEVIPPELENELKNLGLSSIETIEIWPAGLTPAKWDVDGIAEWLSDDNPCIKIKADHSISRFLIEVVSSEEVLELIPEIHGEPLFVKLPRLDIGKHSIKISAFKGDDLTIPTIERFMEIKIREPLPHVIKNNTNNGFFVTVIPSEPSLEEFWEDKIDLEITGPGSKKVKPSLIFYDNDFNIKNIKEEETWEAISLPVANKEWKETLAKIKKSTPFKKFQRIYDSVNKCELSLNAEELGIFKLRLERKSSPIRWELSKRNNVHNLKLLDSNDEGENIKVEYYSYEKPDKKKLLNVNEFFSPNVSLEGGLYVARFEKTISAIIVCPDGNIENLRRTKPIVNKYDRNWENIKLILDKKEVWEKANLPGEPLGQILHEKVLEKIEAEFFRLFCGDRWIEVESQYSNNKNNDIFLDGLNEEKEKSLLKQFLEDNNLEQIKMLEPNNDLKTYLSEIWEKTNPRGYKEGLLGKVIDLAINKNNELDNNDDEELIKNLFNEPYLVKIARALALIRKYSKAVV